jgi:hypothetical protein
VPKCPGRARAVAAAITSASAMPTTSIRVITVGRSYAGPVLVVDQISVEMRSGANPSALSVDVCVTRAPRSILCMENHDWNLKYAERRLDEFNAQGCSDQHRSATGQEKEPRPKPISNSTPFSLAART